ncbi:MAG: NAD(P)H-dependent oxidoreductase subunit E [Betaproteobacteria bacterium]
MDLHLIPGARATPEEREAIDRAIASVPTASLRPPASMRSALLPALHAVHARVGWISEGALNHVCQRLSIAPAEAHGVASFYAMFSLKPRPATVVHVCDDIACRTRGAEALCEELERRLGPEGSGPKDRGASVEGTTWLRSPCLGQCERGPAALFQVSGEAASNATLAPADAEAIVRGVPPGPARTAVTSAPQTEAPRARGLRLLARLGVSDPASLDDYRAHGGYSALRRALAIGPEAVLREVGDSRLVGRGGAAFPTGRKWEAVARAPVRPHYLVCNADESEPGTFKDRVLMEEDPFALVEAMTIAGYATGCERGFLYIRGEYPLATARMTSAVAQARVRGLLGEDVFGEGVRFDIELRRGAGAYICGEETALFNSIEGLRGEPRNKPPFPVQSGLFGKPTVVNNVETLVNVLQVVLEGGPAFAATGTGGSTGTKLFCVSGTVVRPGVYEVPFGTTLRQLVDLAGGVGNGRRLQAILLGGAAGVFVTPGELDMPLTLEGARAAGATLGSGVVMLFDDATDMTGIVRRIARFFRDESCGQCVPCRVGTVRQDEALERLASRRGSPAANLAIVSDVGQVMRDASICGLGQTASSAIESAVRKLNLFVQETA